MAAFAPPRRLRTCAIRVAAALCAVIAVGCVSAARSQGAISAANFGVNISPVYSNEKLVGPSGLSMASASGLSLVRVAVTMPANDDWTQIDSTVGFLAASGKTLYPMMGLPKQLTSAQASTQMTTFVTEFAQRYGPSGSFWSSNPSVPAEPIIRYEIGDEPNLPSYWVQDNSNLHWDDPNDYAAVYNASRTALHAVNPNLDAVFGGLADSASNGVDVQSDETWLAATVLGPVDAVGYHPWVFDEDNSLLVDDTATLRVWMNQNGFSGVPLDVNEFGACETSSVTSNNNVCPKSQPSATWGAAVADYMNYAMCTHAWLDVDNFQPEYWGAIPSADTNVWMPFLNSKMALTPYGQAFMGEAQALISGQCSTTGGGGGTPATAPANTQVPTISGSAVVGQTLTADRGTWSGNPTPSISYQWERCAVGGQRCITVGSSDKPYTVQDADVGSVMRVLATATNTAGGATAQSAPTALVTAAPTGSGTGSGSGNPAGGNGGSGTGSKPGSSKSHTKKKLQSMHLHLVRFRRHGRTIVVTVSRRAGSGRLIVTVSRRGHRARHLRGHAHNRSTTTFRVTLAPGHWTLTATAAPSRGYAKPTRSVRRLVIPARRAHR